MSDTSNFNNYMDGYEYDPIRLIKKYPGALLRMIVVHEDRAEEIIIACIEEFGAHTPIYLVPLEHYTAKVERAFLRSKLSQG